MDAGNGLHVRARIKELELTQQRDRERDAETDPEHAFTGAIESDEDIVIRRAEQHRRERETAAAGHHDPVTRPDA
ncbi:MAG: hypothetical protein WCK58_08365 [Chloroflexota bacterium]